MDNLRPGWTALLLIVIFTSNQTSAADDLPSPKPIVAPVWEHLGGPGAKEVVIEPDTMKLKAFGLTLEDLRRATHRRRFVSGEWSIEIRQKQFDLAQLAKLTVRELQSPPFTVKLRDGREVMVTPDPKRVGHYVVTGEHFEQDVRARLAEFTGAHPEKICVLQMIPVPGNVGPHFTEAGSMRHFSVGEPLETFAKVEVRRKKQPLDAPTTPAR